MPLSATFSHFQPLSATFLVFKISRVFIIVERFGFNQDVGESKRNNFLSDNFFVR